MEQMQDIELQNPSLSSSTSLSVPLSSSSEDEVKLAKESEWILISLPSAIVIEEAKEGTVKSAKRITEYYYNRITSRIAWDLSRTSDHSDDSSDDEEEEEEDELLPGWTEREDENGKRVFFNDFSQSTTFLRP